MIVYVHTDNGGTLNLRNEPNGSTILDRISNGAKVDAPEGITSEWTKVTYNNKNGYVMSKFLTTENKLKQIYDSLQATLKLIEEVLK